MALVRVRDEIADLVLRVVHPVRTHTGQLGEFFALHTKALVVGEVPVQHVHFHRGQTIHIALEHVERNEMPADVDEQPSPGKTRLIFDGDCRDDESGRSDFDQLEKCL